MLVVKFLNDKTGTEKVGNYIVTVSVNGRTLNTYRIEGHERKKGWRALVRELAQYVTTEQAKAAFDE